MSLFSAVLVGRVEKYIFAVGEEKFAGGRTVFPAHTAGLAQIEDAGFGLLRTPATGVSLGK